MRGQLSVGERTMAGLIKTFVALCHYAVSKKSGRGGGGRLHRGYDLRFRVLGFGGSCPFEAIGVV